MNVSEINPGTFGSIAHYIEVALPLTLLTAWIMVAFQSAYIVPEGTTFFQRLGWPVLMIKTIFESKKKEENKTPGSYSRTTTTFGTSKENLERIEITSPGRSGF